MLATSSLLSFQQNPLFGQALTRLLMRGIKSNRVKYRYKFRVFRSVLDLRNSLTPPLDVTALVIAGGGGGSYAGGGAAGGYRTSIFLGMLLATNYPVTVGAGATGSGNIGGKGSPSVFHNITSTGGGGGVYSNDTSQKNGGSGGGGQNTVANGDSTRVRGTGNEGGYSPSEGNNGGEGSGGSNGGGGGGKGAVGGNAAGSVGGTGGAGETSDITGTPVGRAGGGGGAGTSGGSASDGGGARGADGTANTGGGGGGGVPGFNGGSGVVILAYPDIYTITLGAGLTGTEYDRGDGSRYVIITAGTGNVSWNFV